MSNVVVQFYKKVLLMHKFQKSKLKTKILAYSLILTTIPLTCIGYFSYFFTGKVIEQNTSQNVKGILVQANETIDYYLRDLVNVAAVLNVNDQFTSLIKQENEPLSKFQKIKNEYEISGILSSVANTKREIYSVALFSDKSIYYPGSAPQESVKDMEWYQMVKNGREDKIFVANNSIQINNSPKYVYSLVYGLRDIKSASRLGVLIVNLDDRVIKNVIDKISFSADSSIFLIDQRNKIAYGSKNNLLKSIDYNTSKLIGANKGQAFENINGEKYFVIMHTSSYSGWNIVWFIPYKTLMAKANEISNIIFAITLICIIIAFVISFTVAENITTPIKKLVTDMNVVEQGNLDVRVNYRSFYEIGVLSDNFNNMVSEIKELINKVYKEQNAKRRAEIKVLETQINPHFLYNTLDSIKWVAILQKADNAAAMITNLVKLLQISLSGGREFINISQEVEHVKNYLEIQRFRYNDRFDVEFKINEEILEYKTLKVILQPLVENALFYGIEPKRVRGTIVISGDIEGDKLVLSVEDDGVGMDCSSLEELAKRQNNAGNRMYKGIGIRNIDERVKLYFGEKYGLKFYSELGVGTKVSIELPLIQKEEKYND